MFKKIAASIGAIALLGGSFLALSVLEQPAPVEKQTIQPGEKFPEPLPLDIETPSPTEPESVVEQPTQQPPVQQVPVAPQPEPMPTCAEGEEAQHDGNGYVCVPADQPLTVCPEGTVPGAVDDYGNESNCAPPCSAYDDNNVCIDPIVPARAET